VDRRNAYHFVDVWQVPAPIERVWSHIRDVKGYPRWWKQFVEARPQNDLNGVGAIVWVDVKAVLPYHLYFEIEAVREEPPHLAAARLRGDLNGETMWKLESHGDGTRLIFEETVVTGKALLSILTPLLRPLFAWNHAIAARHGERGLRRILAEGQPHKTPAAS
jgi:hypothetical protein